MGQDLGQVARAVVSNYSNADWNGLKALFTPDGIYNEIGSQRKFQGPDAIIRTLQDWKKSMTDSSGSVTNVFTAGNMAALEVTWQGTQDGPFTTPAGTLPPSGKHQRTQAVMIIKFQGDKIAELSHYFDMVTFLQQIGAMPAAAAHS